jgi:hypothetical protein
MAFRGLVIVASAVAAASYSYSHGWMVAATILTFYMLPIQMTTFHNIKVGVSKSDLKSGMNSDNEFQ